MSTHRNPTAYGCSTPAGAFLGCRKHYLNDETASYYLNNTISSTSPFNPGGGAFSVYDNKYDLALSSGSYVINNLSSCYKKGWYGFLAGKYWHGRLGFHNPQGCYDTTYYTSASVCNCGPYNQPDYCGCWNSISEVCTTAADCTLWDDAGCIDNGSGFGCAKQCHGSFTTKFMTGSSCPVEAIHSSPITTKYLTVTATGTMTWTSGSSTLTVSLTSTATVDKFTGIVTATYNYDTSSTGNASFMQNYLANDMSSAANINCPWLYDSGSFDPGCPQWTNYVSSTNTDPNSICYRAPITQDSIIQNRWNWFVGAELTGLAADWCSLVGSGINGSSTMTHSDTVISVTKHLFGENAESYGLGSTYDLSFTVTLSDPYTSDDVNAECEALLQNWTFDDVREWFTGEVDWTSCPYVCYNEVNGPVSPMSGLFSLGFVDINNSGSMSGSYDGAVMGAPMPKTVAVPGSGSQTATYGPYWNKKHQNWEVDVCLGLTVLPKRSDPSTGSYINVDRATEKIPDFISIAGDCGDTLPVPSMRQACGFRQYRVPAVGNFMIGKYAEIFLGTRPSANWDEPFASGSDHNEWTRDPNTQDCSAGSKHDLSYVVSASWFYMTSSTIGSFANPIGNPMWTGLVTKSANDFWNDAQRKFDFVSVVWNYNYRDYQETNRYNNNVSGTCHNPGAMVAKIRPGTNELSNVTASDNAITYSACRANILVVQPASNTSSFSRYNAKVFDLPKVDCDEQYGSLIQVAPVQWMTLPWWFAPLKPCGTGSVSDPTCNNITWAEDDGQIRYLGFGVYTDGTLCQADAIYDTNTGCNTQYEYYPMRPYVEARASVPNDLTCNGQAAPSLDSKAHKIGCSTYMNDRNTLYLTGSGFANPTLLCELCDPPVPVVHTATFRTPLTKTKQPWVIQQLQEDCTNAAGRFANIYSANGGGSGLTILEF